MSDRIAPRSAMPAHRCHACLDDVDPGAVIHPRCALRIFGEPNVPHIDLDLARMHTMGLAMVGRSSLAGVQRKLSLRVTGKRSTLRLEVGAGSYILKPQAQTFPHLPENEAVTLLLASACGIDVAPSCLLRLKDDTLAFLTRRFDRVASGRKLRQEDFCQLAGRAPKQKYEGSAELCVRLVKRYATEPGIAALRLFRLLLFCWWTGNGDAHLKNFSLLTDENSRHSLAPGYDLLSTRLVIPDDALALPVGGKQQGLTRRTWTEFAAYAGLPSTVAAREIAAPGQHLATAGALIERSFLPASMQAAYLALLEERAGILSAS